MKINDEICGPNAKYPQKKLAKFSQNLPEEQHEDLFGSLTVFEVWRRSIEILFRGVRYSELSKIKLFDVYAILTFVILVPGSLISYLLERVYAPNEASFINYVIDFSLTLVPAVFTIELASVAMVQATAYLYARSAQKWFICFLEGLGRLWIVMTAKLVLLMLLSVGAATVWYTPQLIGIAFLGYEMNNDDDDFNETNVNSPLWIILVFMGVLLLGCWMYVALAMEVLVPVIMVEKRAPISAMRRSFRISRENKWYIFWATVLTLIPKALLGVAFSYALREMTGEEAEEFMATPRGFFVVVILPIMIVLPFASITKVVIYISLRVQQDGLHKLKLRNHLGIDQDAIDLDDAGSDDVSHAETNTVTYTDFVYIPAKEDTSIQTPDENRAVV